MPTLDNIDSIDSSGRMGRTEWNRAHVFRPLPIFRRLNGPDRRLSKTALARLIVLKLERSEEEFVRRGPSCDSQEMERTKGGGMARERVVHKLLWIFNLGLPYHYSMQSVKCFRCVDKVRFLQLHAWSTQLFTALESIEHRAEWCACLINQPTLRDEMSWTPEIISVPAFQENAGRSLQGSHGPFARLEASASAS